VFDAYNIGGNNYFKLRDLAIKLSGTEKQFEVGYDDATRAISLTSGKAYTPVGDEMASKGAGSQKAVFSTSKIMLDGADVNLAAFLIGGNNYFKLRDIGAAFDFGVTWDGERNTIIIDTSTGYTPEDDNLLRIVTGSTTLTLPNIDGMEVTLTNYANGFMPSTTLDGLTDVIRFYIVKGGSVSFSRDLEIEYMTTEDSIAYSNKYNDFVDPETGSADLDAYAKYEESLWQQSDLKAGEGFIFNDIAALRLKIGESLIYNFSPIFDDEEYFFSVLGSQFQPFGNL
jgi:hypothetical protein